MSHTPGPWRIGERRGEHITIQHSDDRPGAISRTLALVTARPSWGREAEANATLIASAPDLLRVVVSFLERHNAEARALKLRLIRCVCRDCDAFRALVKPLLVAEMVDATTDYLSTLPPEEAERRLEAASAIAKAEGRNV